MEQYTLIFSITHDHHADRVESLMCHNSTPIRLNLDNLSEWKVYNRNRAAHLIYREQFISFEQIISVFVRRIPSFDSFLNDVPEIYADYKDFIAKQEFQLFTDCLSILDEEVYFMNPLKSTKNLGKAVQERIAFGVGLRTPATYIGSSPDIAKEFIADLRAKGKRISTKPISNVKVTIDGVRNVRFTELMSEEDECYLDTLTDCPVIFQEYIEKKYEVRGVFINGKILAASIHSQEAPGRTVIDWRHYNIAQTPHYALSLPFEIEKKLVQLHEKLGVYYSAFDLIVTSDDEFVFLETNPYGQWLWIEDLTGLKITEEIAQSLSAAGKK